MLFNASIEPIGRRRIKKKRLIKSKRNSDFLVIAKTPGIEKEILISSQVLEEPLEEQPIEEKNISIPITKIIAEANSKNDSTKLPSWKDLENMSIQQEAKAEKKGDPMREGLETNFDLNALRISWNQYSTLIFDQKKLLFYSLLTTLKYEPAPSSLIKVFLKNSVQQVSFNSEKTEFLEFLRKELKNSSIDFDFQILEQNENENPEIAFTNKEKFLKLAESNPILADFKRRFDLDLDI